MSKLQMFKDQTSVYSCIYIIHKVYIMRNSKCIFMTHPYDWFPQNQLYNYVYNYHNNILLYNHNNIILYNYVYTCHITKLV